MEHSIEVYRLYDDSWAVWYKDEQGEVHEKYVKTFDEVSRFIEGELL